MWWRGQGRKQEAEKIGVVIVSCGRAVLSSYSGCLFAVGSSVLFVACVGFERTTVNSTQTHSGWNLARARPINTLRTRTNWQRYATFAV